MTDLAQMTDEELAAEVDSWWREAMRCEAASRGFDHDSAKWAWDHHYAAKAELELRKCRKAAEPLMQLIDALVTGEKP